MQVGDILIEGPFCHHRLTVMFEDSDGGSGESGSQDQRDMVQFITQNQTALQDTRPTLICINDLYVWFVVVYTENAALLIALFAI